MPFSGLWRQISCYYGGRFIDALLMTVGVGLFGTFTAYLASWFVGEGKGWLEMKVVEEGNCYFKLIRHST